MEYFDRKITCKNFNNEFDQRDVNNIKSLIRQATRWSNASLQDKSPLVATLHANYGVGYISAVQDLYNADDVKKVTGEDFNFVKNKILAVQDSATKKMVKVCPKYAQYLDKDLAILGGESL